MVRRERFVVGGHRYVLYENRYDNRSRWMTAAIIAGLVIPTVVIARHLYVVEAERASYDDIYGAFYAPPIERPERVYTLDEVRHNYPLRARMRSVDVDTITFATGSWEIDSSQYGKLKLIADAMKKVIDDNPAEVFLIEGHTDRVGNTEDNLSLSDRRAESVARVLTEEFGIYPENLTTQGYGEEFPKVDDRRSRAAQPPRHRAPHHATVSGEAPPPPR